jgi:hypothetical protein
MHTQAMEGRDAKCLPQADGSSPRPTWRARHTTVRRRPAAPGNRKISGRLMMEAAGIEPASAVAPVRTSTSVVCGLISLGGRFADDLPTS